MDELLEKSASLVVHMDVCQGKSHRVHSESCSRAPHNPLQLSESLRTREYNALTCMVNLSHSVLQIFNPNA